MEGNDEKANDNSNDEEHHGSQLIKKHSLNKNQIIALESDIFKVMQSDSSINIESLAAAANRMSGADIPFSIEYSTGIESTKNQTEETVSKSSCCGKPQISNDGVSKGPISDYSVMHNSRSLLPPKEEEDISKNTLVVDIDETLVHSSFSPMTTPDFVFPFKLESGTKKKNDDSNDPPLLISVRVRPFAQQFLTDLSKYYEIVIFSNFDKTYTDEILTHIDPNHKVKHILYRDSILEFNGTPVKDLSLLGRDLNKIIIIDNNQASYLLQPYNAIQISTWYRNKNDTELFKIMQFLIENHEVTDIYSILVAK